MTIERPKATTTISYLLKVLTGDVSLGTEVLVHQDQDGGHDTEKRSETEHDKVSNTDRKGSLSAEEGLLAGIAGKGGCLLSDKSGHGESPIGSIATTAVEVLQRERMIATAEGFRMDIGFKPKFRLAPLTFH